MDYFDFVRVKNIRIRTIRTISNILLQINHVPAKVLHVPTERALFFSRDGGDDRRLPEQDAGGDRPGHHLQRPQSVWLVSMIFVILFEYILNTEQKTSIIIQSLLWPRRSFLPPFEQFPFPPLLNLNFSPSKDALC